MGGMEEGLDDLEYLAANGVRIALQGHLPFMAAVQAAYDTLKALRSGTPPAELRAGTASAELIGRVTRKAIYDGWIEDFLS